MATATVPAKIVMKGTSQMSLHARFTQFAATQQDQQVLVRNPKLMLAENRRLAREMERRPNVMAALRLRNSEQSVMQRLSAKARLGYRAEYRMRRRNYYSGYRPGGRTRAGSFRGRGRPSPYGRMTPGQWARAVLSGTYVPMPPRRRGFWGRGGFRRGGWRGSRGRGRGARGGRSPMKAIKEDLDKQLDEYMAKTKPHLDTQLDSYMAEVMG